MRVSWHGSTHTMTAEAARGSRFVPRSVYTSPTQKKPKSGEPGGLGRAAGPLTGLLGVLHPTASILRSTWLECSSPDWSTISDTGRLKQKHQKRAVRPLCLFFYFYTRLQSIWENGRSLRAAAPAAGGWLPFLGWWGGGGGSSWFSPSSEKGPLSARSQPVLFDSRLLI